MMNGSASMSASDVGVSVLLSFVFVHKLEVIFCLRGFLSDRMGAGGSKGTLQTPPVARSLPHHHHAHIRRQV